MRECLYLYPAAFIVRSVLTYRFAEIGFNIYHLVRDGPKNQPIKAFPKGLRMVAGDTNRKTYNASSFADQAVSFVCLGTSQFRASKTWR